MTLLHQMPASEFAWGMFLIAVAGAAGLAIGGLICAAAYAFARSVGKMWFDQ